MKTEDNNNNIQLTTKDRQILVEIAHKSIFNTKKGLLIRNKQKLLSDIKPQWQDHQIQ